MIYTRKYLREIGQKEKKKVEMIVRERERDTHTSGAEPIEIDVLTTKRGDITTL